MRRPSFVAMAIALGLAWPAGSARAEVDAEGEVTADAVPSRGMLRLRLPGADELGGAPGGLDPFARPRLASTSSMLLCPRCAIEALARAALVAWPARMRLRLVRLHAVEPWIALDHGAPLDQVWHCSRRAGAPLDSGCARAASDALDVERALLALAELVAPYGAGWRALPGAATPGGRPVSVRVEPFLSPRWGGIATRGTF